MQQMHCLNPLCTNLVITGRGESRRVAAGCPARVQFRLLLAAEKQGLQGFDSLMSFSIVFHTDNEHTHTHTEHENSLKCFWACDSCQLDHTLWVVQEFRQKHQSKDPAVLECIQPPLPLWELEFILATVFYSRVSLSLVSGNCLVIHRVENDSICNCNCNYIYAYVCAHTQTQANTERHPGGWAEFSALHREQKLIVLLM